MYFKVAMDRGTHGVQTQKQKCAISQNGNHFYIEHVNCLV